MLQVTHVSKIFTGNGAEVKAVDDMSLTIQQGEFVAIVGRSGSGKTTLMSLLGALDKPTNGTISVDGQNITNLSDRKLVDYRANEIGFVFQSYNLVPNLTAMENVLLAMEFAHMPYKQRKQTAQSSLEQVGLTDAKRRRKPSYLSGGEQQRVAIARALVNQPKLILADEPTGNLDSQTGTMIVDLLRDISRTNNTTIVVVTHDIALARQADRTFRVQDGKLVQTIGREEA